MIIKPDPPDLVDALGAPLRDEPLHTYSTGPYALPPITMESILDAAESAGIKFTPRRPRVSPPPDFEPPSFSLMPYVAFVPRYRYRPVIVFDDVAESTPPRRPPYLRCAACGAKKRTIKRQRWRYCRRCAA